MAPPSAAARSHDPATYFRTSRPFFAVVILGGMFYYGCAVLAPSIIPYDSLGPLGRVTQYLQENHKTAFHRGYAGACFIHLVEGCVSVWLCKKKGITDGRTQLWWFVQSFLFGFASLYFLLDYKPPKKTE